MITITTHSEDETFEVGRRLGQSLRRGDLVALMGELGTGKTVLARGIAVGLGAAGYIASPTFTLIREYSGPTPVYHVDLYRLEPREADELGLEEVLDRGVTVIEWAEKAADLLRPPLMRIEIAFGGGPAERIIRLVPEGPGPVESASAIAGPRTPA